MNIEQPDYCTIIKNLKHKMQSESISEKQPVEHTKDGIFPHLLAALPSLLSGYELQADRIESREDLKEYLNNRFQITDKQTAIEGIRLFLFENTHLQFEQFKSFWEGQPVFELKDLEEKSKDYFVQCKEFAHQFYQEIKDFGFAGFDYGESIRMAKECFTVGYLEEADYQFMLSDIANRAFRQFNSWEEYAISYLCGGTYFIYYSSGLQKEYADNMFQTLFGGISELYFKGDQLWNTNAWPEGKKYFLQVKEVKQLIEDNRGCLVSDRISIEGCPIGYMVREEPSEGNPDSGWQFFAGDEDPAYLEDLSKVQVFALNTVCNYEQRIVELLDAPVGSAYERREDGSFQQVK